MLRVVQFLPNGRNHCLNGGGAARIFLQLIADFVVYLGLLVRPIERSLDRAKSLATPSQ